MRSLNKYCRVHIQNALIFFLLFYLLGMLFMTRMPIFSNISVSKMSPSTDNATLCKKETLLQGTVNDTVQGPKSYGEILKLVYEPFGYEYDEVMGRSCTPNSVLFPLKYKSLHCPQVFLEWLDVQMKSNITADTQVPPPSEIPENLKNQYLLNGLAKLNSWYYDEIPAHLPPLLIQKWTQALLDQYFNWYRENNWNPLPYTTDCAAIFYSLKQFKPTEKTGMVIGSQTPWAEAMVLSQGAAKVITVEYASLTVEVATIEYVHPVKLVETWDRYTNMDFVVSFSSIEHSGLGRYGDSPDPIGDFRELSKILCLLKQGGLLYIGLPSGPDTVEYNAHRQYGYVRWPMIAAGFEFVGAFYGTNPEMYTSPPPISGSDWHKQYVFVLRKK